MKERLFNPRLMGLSAILSASYLLVIHANSDTVTETRTIIVQPRISELEPGLVLVDSPSTIRLTVDGPAERLDRMEQDPSNAITIGPVGPSDLNWRLSGDDFHLPDGVSIVAFIPREIQLPVQPLIEVEVSVDAIIQGRPADGFDIGTTTVTPSELTLRGPQSFLAEVTRMETTPVDIDGATGDVRQEVSLNNLRAFVEVVDPEPIVVAVSITNNTDLVEVEAPIVFTSADAERCSSATEALSARFEGPVSTIGNLNRSLIMATIDCRSLVEAGDGRHQVRPEIIGHPTDLTVVWRSLDAVMVEVSPPPASPEPEPVPDSAGSGSIEQ